MRILCLTNYHNPYRDDFFEQFRHECSLTVLFERKVEASRDASWFEGVTVRSHEEVYLPEGEQGLISPTIQKMIGGGSLVVVGCYNSSKQIAVISYMRRRRIPYVVNSDGSLFELHGFRSLMRRHALCGADAYLVAGDTSVLSIRREVGRGAVIVSYPFSTLSKARIDELATIRERRDKARVLLVGQFLSYKGIDVALGILAGMSRDLHYCVPQRKRSFCMGDFFCARPKSFRLKAWWMSTFPFFLFV